jgi:hypothetical protein
VTVDRDDEDTTMAREPRYGNPVTMRRFDVYAVNKMLHTSRLVGSFATLDEARAHADEHVKPSYRSFYGAEVRDSKARRAASWASPPVVYEVWGSADAPGGERRDPARRRPNPSVTMGPEFFQGALKDYENWKEKWWREAIQNSVDAGATRIDCIAKQEEDGAWTISVEDDGGGMSRETIEHKFLVLGGTTKVGATGAAGGFGKAKELLLLPWLSWEIHSRDTVLRGAGGTGSDFEDAPMIPGTKLTVRMSDSQHTYDAPAMAFIQKCYLPNVRFTVNGTVIKANLQAKKLIREIPGKAAIYFTPSKDAQAQMLVRTKGLYMFDTYLGEDVKGYVIVEILGPSIELLSANRDGFRDWETKRAVEQYGLELAKDTKSALRAKAGLIRQVFRGEGTFRAERDTREVEKRVGPIDAGTPKQRQEMIERIVTVTSEYREESDRKDTPLAKPDRSAIQAMMDLAPATEMGFENAIAQLVWTPDFYVMNEVEGFHVPKEFFPATMGPRITKIASVWTELCRFVLIQLGSKSRFGVGFVFSNDSAAMYARHEGENWLLLNPYRDMKNLKYLWRTTTNEDLQWLYAAAIHECTHLADGISYHDESFASALTSNMAKCARGWRKVKEIEQATGMGKSAEADVEGKPKAARAPAAVPFVLPDETMIVRMVYKIDGDRDAYSGTAALDASIERMEPDATEERKRALRSIGRAAYDVYHEGRDSGVTAYDAVEKVLADIRERGRPL